MLNPDRWEEVTLASLKPVGVLLFAFIPTKVFFRSVLSSCLQRLHKAPLEFLLSSSVTASLWSWLCRAGCYCLGDLSPFVLQHRWMKHSKWNRKTTSFCASPKVFLLLLHIVSVYSLNSNTMQHPPCATLSKAPSVLRQMAHRPCLQSTPG